MKLEKNDFIELEFTARIKEGGIFDSNKKEDLAKAGISGETKPFIFSLGNGMFLKGIENFLIGKEIGEYSIELTPENSFGKRNPKLIQMIPLKEFRAQQVNPLPGQIFDFDGKLAKVLTVSGGRIMVDFNGPLAGKDVIYEIKILRKIENLNEKIEALIDFFFRKPFEFEVKEKELEIKVEKDFLKFVELFKSKFKEILDLELIFKEIDKK